jgi:peptidoglycan/LPS O-acetylase OafA/YrhL
VQKYYDPALDTIIAHGFLGVSIFFVISGYGIASSIHLSGFHPAASRAPLWLWNRWKRVYPTFWWQLVFAALIIPLAILPFVLLKSNPAGQVFCHYSFFEWLQYITLTKVFSSSSWSLDVPFWPLNGAVWFLAIIVQIYMVVALCMLLARRRRQLSSLLYILFFLSLITLAPGVKAMVPCGLFLPYFREFYIGMLVFYSLERGLSPKANILTIAILALLLCSLYFCARLNRDLLSLNFAGITGCIFLILHKYDQKLNHFRIVRPFKIIGVFSYSLYLIHQPLSPLAGIFVRNLIPLSPRLTWPFVLIPGIVVVSYFWYLFFEKQTTALDVYRALTHPVRTISSGGELIAPLYNFGRFFKAGFVLKKLPRVNHPL